MSSTLPLCFFEASPATKNHIGIDGMELHTGAVITPYLLDADRYVLFIATAGQEFEQFQHEVKSSGDILQEFCLIPWALQLRRQLYAKCVVKLKTMFCHWDMV